MKKRDRKGDIKRLKSEMKELEWDYKHVRYEGLKRVIDDWLKLKAWKLGRIGQGGEKNYDG